MVGSYEIEVARRRSLKYRFTIKRNITVVRGESGSGKTTLYDMVADHTRLGSQSGVTIKSDRPCVALTDVDWQNQIKKIDSSIIFIDEGFAAIKTEEFARAVKGSDNYFVLITRAELQQLPYSISEIYEIKTSGKFHTFKPLYGHDDHLRYFSQSRAKPKRDFSMLLTEDAKAGFEFYASRFEDSEIVCATAESNAKILGWLNEHMDERVFVVADGAAFGPFADRILKLQNAHRDNITICLPESFEWLLLQSGLIKSTEVEKVLADPSSHIESDSHESWEQFFTELLKAEAKGTPFAYRKDKLGDAYKVPKNADKVMEHIACRNVE